MNVHRAAVLGVGLALIVGAVAFAMAWLARTQTYTVEGRVAGVEDGGHTLYVEHEEIPGYMPAMTMPLPVEDSSEAASLDERAAIRFQLNVTGDSAWIEAVETIADSAVDEHPARSVQPMAGEPASTGQMLREGDRVPADFTLINQDGDSVRIGDFRGRVLVLSFIYTRCPLPNYCPLMSKQFAALQPQLREQFGSKAHLLSISFDPAHDTPEVLREYSQKYTDRLDTWTFATADSTEIQQLTSRFGVFTEQEDGEILHNLTTAVVGPDGTIRHLFRGNDWTPEDVMRAVEGTVN